MDWYSLITLIILIVVFTWVNFCPIGDINARLGYIQSKMKKVKLGPFLIKIVPQRDTIGTQNIEYPPKGKEVYLLTVILTFMNIILAPVLIVASVLAAVFTDIDLIVFFFCIGGYEVLLAIIIFTLEIIKSNKK